MTVTWLGHACFMLESGGYRIVIDPCKGVPGVKDTACETETVYWSHSHFDHCYTDELRFTEGKESSFTVTGIAAFHDDEKGAKRGENTIHTFTAEGITVAHMGDLGHQLGSALLAAMGEVDILLLPVGGTYTLDCEGAKAVVDAMKPRLVIPMHYRRGNMGFDVLQTVDEFTALFPGDAVHELNTNTLTVTDELLHRGGVAVLTL